MKPRGQFCILFRCPDHAPGRDLAIDPGALDPVGVHERRLRMHDRDGADLPSRPLGLVEPRREGRDVALLHSGHAAMMGEAA